MSVLSSAKKKGGIPLSQEAKQEFGLLLASCLTLSDSLSFH